MTIPSGDDRGAAFALLASRPDDPKGLAALRYSVIAMGLVLLVGFGVVIGRIVYLTMRPTVPESISGLPAQASGPQAWPTNITLPLPAGAKVISQTLDQNRLALSYAVGDTPEIIIIDLATGTTLTRIHTTPAPR